MKLSNIRIGSTYFYVIQKGDTWEVRSGIVYGINTGKKYGSAYVEFDEDAVYNVGGGYSEEIPFVFPDQEHADDFVVEKKLAHIESLRKSSLYMIKLADELEASMKEES